MSRKPSSLQAIAKPNTEESVVNASLITGGPFSASAVLNAYQPSSTELPYLFEDLTRLAASVQGGDMQKVEELLLCQAIALQGMFTDFALRAKKERSIEGIDCLTKLALRAQSNSRATLQTLAEVKNPRQVAFVKQTNVAQNQQINNSSQGKESQSAPNELFGGNRDGRKSVDRRAATAAVRVDQKLATLEPVNRSSKRLGQAHRL